MPRRRCVGMTATAVSPAAGTAPPGVVIVSENVPAAPTSDSPSYAPRRKVNSWSRFVPSMRSGFTSAPKAVRIGWTNSPYRSVPSCRSSMFIRLR